MESLIIEPTTTSPSVVFNFEKGELKLSGKSIIEDPVKLYDQFIEWVENYSAEPKPKTTVSIDLDYCNTSSSKCLVGFLKKAVTLKDKGTELVIKWYYDEGDDDTFETGNDFSRLTKFPFEFIEKT